MEQQRGEWGCNGELGGASARARARSVGGLMLQASHRLSSRRYADPAARLPYFNASVIGSPPATGILKASRATHRSPLFNPADQECLVSSLR